MLLEYGVSCALPTTDLPSTVRPENGSLPFAACSPSVFALPAVGVPAADRYHDAFVAAKQRGEPVPYLVYDETGVLARWMGHLDWLDQHLPIRTLKVADIMTKLTR